MEGIFFNGGAVCGLEGRSRSYRGADRSSISRCFDEVKVGGEGACGGAGAASRAAGAAGTAATSGEALGANLGEGGGSSTETTAAGPTMGDAFPEVTILAEGDALERVAAGERSCSGPLQLQPETSTAPSTAPLRRVNTR